MRAVLARVFPLFALLALASCSVQPPDPLGVLSTLTPTARPVADSGQPTDGRQKATPTPIWACIHTGRVDGYAHLRACPGAACDVLGYLREGTRVWVTGKAEVRTTYWLHVAAGEKRGWVWGPLVGECSQSP